MSLYSGCFTFKMLKYCNLYISREGIFLPRNTLKEVKGILGSSLKFLS